MEEALSSYRSYSTEHVQIRSSSIFSDFKVTHKGASFYAFSIFDKFEVM